LRRARRRWPELPAFRHLRRAGYAGAGGAGIVVLVFFIVYQQLENHLLQPLVYGRTVKLSPLAILISVLIGAEVAGILGALGAIPVAGTIQVLLVDWSPSSS
jgi:predicted PurR-regulated permease PerM